MEGKYRFLILTDHRIHRPGNPIYYLAKHLRAHHQCAYVHIASRGNAVNDPFFKKGSQRDLSVLEVDDNFAFEASGQQFMQTDLMQELSSYDCILMRLTRPIEAAFFDNLARISPKQVIINHPLGIQKTSSKAFLLHFPEICPPMRLCQSVNEIMEFAANFPIVLKPLKEHGGKGILKIEDGLLYDKDISYDPREYLNQLESYIQKEGYLAVKFLKNVSQGDKRILVVGKNILGASLRLPPEDSWLCNVAQGGTAVTADIDPEEAAIIQRLIPVLEKEGILIAGIDTLVGDDGKRVLSEINTLSVGGFLDIQEQSGKPVIAQKIQTIIDYVQQKIG